MRGLMAGRLLPLLETETVVALRSLLPVFRKDKLQALLSLCVSAEAASTFLRITTYSHANNSGVFDVQYQPVIRGGDYCLLPTNVLCSSNLLRNLLYTQRKRVEMEHVDAPPP